MLTNFKTKLRNIENWTNDVKEGTQVLPTKDIAKFKSSESERRKLQTVMTHLRDVKQIREGTMKQFAGMKETFLTLKKHSD
jgi:ribosomal protein S2